MAQWAKTHKSNARMLFRWGTKRFLLIILAVAILSCLILLSDWSILLRPSAEKSSDLADHVTSSSASVEEESDPLKLLTFGAGDNIRDLFNPEKDQFDIFIRWMKKGGATFPKVKMVYIEKDFRIVEAKQSISGGEEVMYVPLNLMMTGLDARESPYGKMLLDTEVNAHTFLAVYLLEHKADPNSKFRYYIATLPKDYKNVPINFDEHEMSFLVGSMSIRKIMDKKQQLWDSYRAVCARIPEFQERFSFDDFVWARTVVITRIFGLMIHGTKTEALVPIADMLNHEHSHRVQTAWGFSDRRNGYLMGVHQNGYFRKGAELFDTYGRKDQSRFFVNYGFTLKDNQADNEAFMVLRAAHKGQPLSRGYQLPMTYVHRSSQNAFSFLRVVHSDEDPNNYNHQSPQSGPISIANELKVLASFADSANEALAQFETTLEEDYAILDSKTYPMFSNLRNAVVMRQCEKEVLHHYLRLFEVGSKLLKMSWRKLRHEVLNYPRDAPIPDAFLHEYIHAVIVPLVQGQA
eukprot:315780_1